MTRYPTLHIVALSGILLAGWSLRAGGQQSGGLETAVFARAIQPGEVVRLDVTCGCDAAGATATAFGGAVRLFPVSGSGTWRGLIGIDVGTRPGTYQIRVVVNRTGPLAPLTTTRELSVLAKRFPTRRLTVAARFVNPPPGELDRIQTEARRLQTLFEAVTSRLWQGSFRAPVAAKPTDSFGMRSVFNGQARSPHGGTDFPVETGTPVAAPAAGSIALAEPLYFTGNTIVIDHGLGLHSMLAHLSAFDVKAGDHVEPGQIVGRVGATGRVTGPHLHWAVRLNGARVDPLSLIAIATADD